MKILSKLMTVALLLIGVQTFAQETVIDQSQLPANAKTFVSKHFAGNQISNVKKEKSLFKTEYEVYMNDGSKLEFDGNGEWKEVESKNKPLSDIAFIPKNIRDYVAKNFPTYQIKKAEKGSRKYEIKLTNGLELEFDLNGNFLRIDD